MSQSKKHKLIQMSSAKLKRNTNLCKELHELLISRDSDFIPPLSSRTSTTQKVFSEDNPSFNGLENYYNELIEQNFILAFDSNNQKLIGFLSYKNDYNLHAECQKEYAEKYTNECAPYSPALYVSTIIVHPDYTGKKIATEMYNRLIKKSHKKNIVTRTWNTNESHIYVLYRLGFDTILQIQNDRKANGRQYDTVYFGRQAQNITWYEKIKAYKLNSKVFVCAFLFLVGLCSQILCHFSFISDNEIINSILSAIFTSLYVSVAVMISEIWVACLDNKREQFLLDAYSFGVASLNKNKQTKLHMLLAECKHEIWISGYRLIMTDYLREDLYNAIKRGAKGSAVLCPPWGEAYKLIYGDDNNAIFHYYRVLKKIHDGMEAAPRKSEFKVFISDIPLFNDTYRIDNLLLSGPYMNTPDKFHGRKMAKDFFSYTLEPGSKLYELTYKEYESIRNDCKLVLSWEKFMNIFEQNKNINIFINNFTVEQIDFLTDQLQKAFISTSEEQSR